MNVVHLASGDLWAGAEKQITVLLSELHKHEDLNLAVVVLNQGRLAEELSALGIPVNVLCESRTNVINLSKQVRKILIDFGAHVLHSHRFKEDIIASIASRGLGCRLVRTLHGGAEVDISAFDFRRKLIRILVKLVDRFCFHRIVTVSDLLVNAMRAGMSAAQQEKVILIPNGISVPKSLTPSLDEHGKDKTWVIGIVGRLVALKRVDVFLQMARLLVRGQVDEWNFEFRIVGAGPLSADLETMANALEVSDIVTFTGHVDNAEVEISKLDFLCICSDHEGLPMVALEAMSSGTTVVSHAVGGLTSLLDQECGVLCYDQVPETYANAICRAIKEERTAQIRVNAHEKLVSEYSSFAMAKNYLSCYQEK